MLSEVKKLAPKDVKIKVRLQGVPWGMRVLGNLDWGRYNCHLQTPSHSQLSSAVSSLFSCSYCSQLMHLFCGLRPREKGSQGWGGGCCVVTGNYIAICSHRSRPLRNGCTPRGLGEAGLTGRALGDHWPRPGGGGWISLPGRDGTLSAQKGSMAQPSGPQESILPSSFPVAPSWPRWIPLRRCGYPKRSMKRMAPVLFIVKPSSARGRNVACWKSRIGRACWKSGRKGESEPLTLSGLGSTS